MPRRVLLGLALGLAACGGSSKPAATPAPTKAAATATPTATSAKVAIDPADEAACQALYVRLKRVTSALSSASELITTVTNQKDLAKQIAIEQQQFERSADLMDAAVVPKPLAEANRQLVAALHAYARGFEKAEQPAQQGDFQGAAQAMSNPDTIKQIVASAQKIQDTCSS